MPGVTDKLFEEQITLASGTNSALFQEAEKLLKMGEELNEKIERFERQSYTYGFAVVSIVVGIVSLLFTFEEVLAGNAYFTVFILFYMVGLVMFGSLRVMSILKRRRRDQRALYEIVDMLRELEHSMMEREQVSQLERAEFRIRLSRFDIGPGWERPGIYSKR